MKTFEQFVNERKGETLLSSSKYINYMPSNNPVKDIEKLKFLIPLNYKGNKTNPDFAKTMEIEWDDKNKLYKVWVEPYGQNELIEGKTGISESHPKGKYTAKLKDSSPEEIDHADLTNTLNNYDYIVLGKPLREDDPYRWVEHEIGHILGYRKGNRTESRAGKTKHIFSDDFKGLYQNTMDEFEPFFQQMKKMKSEGISDEEIINKIMVDYENSVSHKDDPEELKKFRNFFTRFLKEKL